ncbi:MAG TPA: hypothetical protein VHB79_09885 [Polyangiaceae bacterium]|nr:hypothetical protein [Polyangiaceae bacterium]
MRALRPFSTKLGLALVLGLTALVPSLAAPNVAAAAEPALIGPEDGPEGRPHIVLDQLVVPNTVPEQKRVIKVLNKVLKHEQQRVEWGAGRGSRITYRFYLEQLDVSVDHGVLKVRCTALGKLPKGRPARSKLEYGGDALKPRETIDHVLTIVARGVLSRLADLERDRRQRH